MACPTCDHTMQCVGTGIYWCPRCGTLKHVSSASASTEAPMLPLRCRALEEVIVEEGDFQYYWRQLGIEESINVPSNRLSQQREARRHREIENKSDNNPPNSA